MNIHILNNETEEINIVEPILRPGFIFVIDYTLTL